MDIKFFITILLAISIGAYFIPVKNYKKDNADKDIPLVIFEKPLMYTMTDTSINRVVESSHAVRYKTRDELFNADIILTNQYKDKEFQTEFLKADIIIKKQDQYNLTDNVVYKRDDFITLNTNQMFYNDKTRIASNSKPFNGNYYDHFVKGTDLYFDANNKILKSKNTHFEIQMNKK